MFHKPWVTHHHLQVSLIPSSLRGDRVPTSPPGLRNKHIMTILDKPWKAPGSTTSVGEQHTTMPLGLMTWAT